MTILRPKISLLDKSHKEDIFKEAKEILGTQGVFIENDDAKELLGNEGVKQKDSQFLIPEDLIDKCLKTVPSEIKLYDREGEEFLELKNDIIRSRISSHTLFR